MSPPRLVSSCLALAIFIAPTVSSAAPSAKDKSDARALVTDAKKALKDKRPADAATALRQADELDPSSQTKLDLAQALAQAGKLVDATRVLHGLIETLDADTFAAKKALDAAKKQLADVEPRVAKLTVTVKGAPADEVKVRVDAADVDASAEIALDPGSHEVSAGAAGYADATKTVKLDEGAHATTTLTLTRAESDAGSSDAAQSSSWIGPKIPAFAAFGVGAVGLAFGTGFGMLAIGKSNEAKTFCVGTQCSAAAAPLISSSKTAGTVSTASFIVGGVGAAAGVALFLLLPLKKESAQAPRVMPWAGAGQAGVTGAF